MKWHHCGGKWIVSSLQNIHMYSWMGQFIAILHTELRWQQQNTSQTSKFSQQTPHTGVYYENFEENWLHYNNTTLYLDVPELTPEGEVYHYRDATWALATCSLFNCFFRVATKETSKFPVTPLWGNPPVTGGFPSQRASDVWSIFYICSCKYSAVCNSWSVHLGTMNLAGFIAHFATGI